MEDRCLKQVKTASGISVFLLEEIGDARLRCNQLKDYIEEASTLIEKSDHRDQFFEVAGHLLHAIPDTLMRVSKSLDAAAMAVARWDYEEIKDDLRPEKVEQLEDALKDVRVRRVKRKSSQPESPMRVEEAATQLTHVAAEIEKTGHIDTESLTRLIASLEGDSVRTASSNQEVAVTLRRLVAGLSKDEGRPSRLMVAAILRRVLGDAIEVKASERPKKADVGELGVDGPYNMALGFEYIRGAARIAYLRGAAGNQMRQAFDQLASIVSEIGLMCDSVGANDVAGLAIRMSKGVRLARRYLKPDVLESLVLASDEKESRFEEGKPADPTEGMSEEDAKKWKSNTDKYEDKFKKSAAGDRDVLQRVEARFNRLYPSLLTEIRRDFGGGVVLEVAERESDPGDNISCLVSIDEEGLGAIQVIMGRKSVSVDGLEANADVLSREAERLINREAKGLLRSASDEKESKFEEGKPADPTDNMSEEDAKEWKSNTDKYEDKFKSASDEKESRFEEGKPADPTDNMSEDAAKEWKANTDKYEDKFKEARTSTASRGQDPWKV